MDAPVKTPDEIQLMRESGQLLASAFAMLDDVVREGISTMEINDRVEAYILASGYDFHH